MQKTGRRHKAAAWRRRNLPKTFLYTKLTLLFFAVTFLTAYATAQSVTLSAKNMPLKEVFSSIKKQTGYTVFGRNELFKNAKPVTVSVREMPLQQALNTVLADQPIQYRINGTDIILSHKESATAQEPAQLRGDTSVHPAPVSGMIYNTEGLPLQGATVTVKGTKVSTSSNTKGQFKINASASDVLVISYVGYSPAEIAVSQNSPMSIKMSLDDRRMNDVVITGMFNRKAESFTGSSTKITRQELLNAGTTNVFQSLRAIEPTLKIADDYVNGSDPNKMPNMQIRGTSTFPDVTKQYTTDPNMPLFIVDGFESTVQKVYDLDINRIETVTILKDAAAKAIYGSKAANGVVVIETIKVKPGELRIDYTGTINVEMPDLSSYNLTNSKEKLDLEKIVGAYDATSGVPIFGLSKDSLYYNNWNQVQNGVNTDWLAQPVKTAIGYKHTLNMEVGNDALRAGLTLFTGNNPGVMKGSGRENFGGAMTLIYRYKKISFRNVLQYSYVKATNSPYGDFSEYAKLNPYWKPYNADGSVSMLLGQGPNVSTPVYNPLYNVPYMRSTNNYTDLTNNTYLDYTFNNNLKLTARLGFTNTVNGSDLFYSSKHTSFINYVDSAFFTKGSYTKGNGKFSALSGDLNLNYNKSFGRHSLFANAGMIIRQDKSENFQYTAVGFPNDKMDNIIFANQYLVGTKPTGSESVNREIGFLAAGNYSFSDKYFADFSIRRSASSQFGANNPWGTFWSAGIGWNVHKERFFQGMTNVIKQLKLRSSIGYTGSQNFNSYQAMLLYNYFTDKSYLGQVGTYLNGLANENLKWQQRYDFNVGFDMNILDKVTVRFDHYRSTTNNLLTDITTPPSNGFNSYKENLGQLLNVGYEFKVNYRVFSNPANRSSLNLYVSGASNKNTIQKISNSLQSLNKVMDDSSAKRNSNKPLVRFQEGQSLDAIWAVKSNGIDPATGKEIFVKADGTVTDTWNVNDKVVVGNGQPTLFGVFGANYEYKGFSIGFSCRYTTGGQMYNQTLVDKVENADINSNVDKRAYYDSWKKPGDIALYKGLGATRTFTQATSRFVQEQNEIDIASVYAGYDFYKFRFVQKMKMQRLRVLFNMNDPYQFSSIRIERGTSYPFARSCSFTLYANF
ncbi:SusC/RagA family TonB-linked outer membrane protein [Pinibacter soli]|uniref:SusC/RagA family TonB-linked outer membrane protein n=1 Tax=Pinibacter soli TaxID=3044211 RepID=A0ABT6RCJ6_9BACT|nr:SusC/RagA family TonB-linked outer membrane protein [Pinibacter soli]MDI3320288.1 SusC/RagA family TonB-linked outer membrane protein [Pinibacter soli]